MATTVLHPAAPTYRSSLYDWVTTTDHKKIGILYVVNSFLFFFIGGILALLVRTELRGPGPAVPDGPDLQRSLHDARDVDDLPVHHPDAGGLRELRRPAPDRGARHGLPAHQRAVVLDAAARRVPDPAGLRHGRCGGGRLDVLQPAGAGPATGLGRVGAGPVDRGPGARRHELDPGRRQLPRHDLQDARSGNDAVPDVAADLDRARRPRSSCCWRRRCSRARSSCCSSTATSAGASSIRPTAATRSSTRTSSGSTRIRPST